MAQDVVINGYETGGKVYLESIRYYKHRGKDIEQIKWTCKIKNGKTKK